MGFDMSITNPKPGHPDRGYFRFNIAGMGRALDAMEDAGMLHPTDVPTWPRPEDHGADDTVWDWADLDGHVLPDAPEAARRYHELLTAIRADAPEPATGIAVHKLCSNDAWLVTEPEIRAALATWDALTPRAQDETANALVDPDYFFQWIGFLRNASTSGGFHVR